VVNATAYSNIERACNSCKTRTNDCYDAGHIPLKKLNDQCRLGGMKEGCYLPTEKTVVGELYLGSDAAFDEWRDVLCQLVLGRELLEVQDKVESYAFDALVKLDCGETTYPSAILGLKVVESLLADFNTFAARVEKRVASNRGGELPDEEWLATYKAWQRLLQIATDGGVVVFD